MNKFNHNFLAPAGGEGQGEGREPSEASYGTGASRLFEAEEIAAACRQFQELQAQGHSARAIARKFLKKPLNWFTGQNCYLEKFQRDGLAALTQDHLDALAAPRRTGALGPAGLPPWFIQVAQYFYLRSNRDSEHGSVPEAVRRTISLPHLPIGWNHAQTRRLLKCLKLDALPECPGELRETIFAREKRNLPLVPKSIARQISVPPAVMQQYRSPRAAALDNFCAPGSQRRCLNPKTGRREIMLPGDWFGGDDATPGIAVCVPCPEVITPCSQKFGVLIGRFQWLAYHDGRTDKILAHDHVVRPRGSYRAEDILNGMGAVTRAHGIPRIGWQFEGGTFNAKIIQHAIKLLGCEHWRTYSPHQKAIESVFNRVWTRLAVQFPHADMGRYRNENESNCKLYEACKHGEKDPRRFFPTLDIVVAAFDEEVEAHNTKHIRSIQYGTWTPNELFNQYCAAGGASVPASPGPGVSRLRPFSPSMSWIFSPFCVERKIQGMLVRCRVPMFEDFSVPFEFSAPWMPLHRGKKVRLHFNPREPRCRAKIILLEPSGNVKPDAILGDADLIGETAAHIRLIMNWANDDQRAGYIARQRAAQFLRRSTRAAGAHGRVRADEYRDGLGTIIKRESSAPLSGRAGLSEHAAGGASVLASRDSLAPTGGEGQGEGLCDLGASLSDRIAAKLQESETLRLEHEQFKQTHRTQLI